MYTLTTVIHIFVSLLMVVVVLLQVGKGATIGSTFGGGASSQTIFGSAGPATLLTKITIGCAVVFMLTSMYLTYLSGKVRSSSIMGNVPSVAVPPQGTRPTQAPAIPPSGVQSGKAPVTAQPVTPRK